MEVLSPDAAGLARACALLRDGLVVAFPTDTVYGLAAATEAGVERIYELKGRDRRKPLVLMGADREAFAGRVSASEQAADLMRRFWPGPLTLVLPGERASIGVRVPDHPVALALLRAAGPLWTTSANPSGEPEAMIAAEVERALPGVAAVIDGGRAAGGMPSTVADLTGPDPVVLRSGPVRI